MPLTNIKYENTCFYKLCCNDLDITDIYVGHTTDFKSRKTKHKSRCNNTNDRHYNLNVYQFIRAHGGFDNWSMILIDRLAVADGLEAKKRERIYLTTLGATLNMTIPSRNNSEYYLDNRECILAKKKVSSVCACGGKYTYGSKSKHDHTLKHQKYLNSLTTE